MPDLGKYAFEVLLSYGVTITLVIALVFASWREAVRSKRRLDTLEND